MNSVNNVVVSGNLGRDPDVRATGTGKSVANFSVAVTKRYEMNGERKETTTWVRCVAWGKLAEQVAEARKGDGVWLQGEIQSRKYTAKDGSEREVVEVNAATLHVVPRLASSARPASAPPSGGRSQRDDDEIPF